ncbi:MAG TPA: hypothetical protein VJQ44_05625 [Gemmatimonadales bacterium]|nr:hypothetical protein [Gemmatimonadales bacterium]
MRRRTRLALAALAALVAACGDSSSPGSGPLPDDATDAIGLTIRDEIEASLDALTLPTQLAPYGVTVDQLCADPSDPEDTDGDGIPNNAEYILTAPPCRFEDIRNTTLDMVGRLQIEDPDPGPGGAGFAYNGTLVNVRSSFRGKDADHSYSISRNGTRVLTGTTAGLELTTDLQLLRTFSGLSDAAVDLQWAVPFDPDAPLQINHTLPPGALAVTGTMDWLRGTESYALTVTTPEPLHFDAACDAAQRFDAGEVHAAGSFGDLTGYVRVRWGGCGDEPSIDFVEDSGA